METFILAVRKEERLVREAVRERPAGYADQLQGILPHIEEGHISFRIRQGAPSDVNGRIVKALESLNVQAEPRQMNILLERPPLVKSLR